MCVCVCVCVCVGVLCHAKRALLGYCVNSINVSLSYTPIIKTSVFCSRAFYLQWARVVKNVLTQRQYDSTWCSSVTAT